MTTEWGGWTLVFWMAYSWQSDWPTRTNLTTTYGTYWFNNSFSINPVDKYSKLWSSDVLLYLDSTSWLYLDSVSNTDFDWMWHSWTWHAHRKITSLAKTSYWTTYTNAVWQKWSSEIYEFNNNSWTWDTNTIFDLWHDTNHGAAIWKDANWTYKRLWWYQSPANWVFRILVR